MQFQNFKSKSRAHTGKCFDICIKPYNVPTRISFNPFLIPLKLSKLFELQVKLFVLLDVIDRLLERMALLVTEKPLLVCLIDFSLRLFFKMDKFDSSIYSLQVELISGVSDLNVDLTLFTRTACQLLFKLCCSIRTKLSDQTSI